MSGIRNTSGKFSLGSFGRKASDSPMSPNKTNGYNGGGDDFSPSRDHGGGGGGGGGGGSGGPGFDGLGKKLKSGIAHQSFLPSLGNQDLRVLQDVISTEKGVMQASEKLGQETSKAAAALPPYGSSEGPDLQDILSHSATLLGHLANALAIFTNHSSSFRSCAKRIREKEEVLDDLKRRRKNTGTKAETAEKKLAKMGPENKQLPQQTELLERLRVEMRSMDTDIVNQESKLGDFKRQMIKEAMSYKFGGLEELGEKMCIIGELGKLLIEEIPLEETPPGYGRAPYTGFDKTENAVNEAVKCLSTVKFAAVSAGPRPPGLPPHNPVAPLGGGSPNPNRVAAAEEYGHFPGGPGGSPQTIPHQPGPYGLDDSNPYANPYGRDDRYPRFGNGNADGSVSHDPNGGNNQVVWQGPTEEALRAHTQAQGEHRHDYEYEQQRQMDMENAAWRDEQRIPQVPTVQIPTPEPVPGPSGTRHSDIDAQSGINLATPIDQHPPPVPDHSTPGSSMGPGPSQMGNDNQHLQRPWEPLNVKRDRSVSPSPVSLQDGPSKQSSTPPRTSQEHPRSSAEHARLSTMGGETSGIGEWMTSGNTDQDESTEILNPPSFVPPQDTTPGFYTPSDSAAEFFPAPPQPPAMAPQRPASPAYTPTPTTAQIASQQALGHRPQGSTSSNLRPISPFEARPPPPPQAPRTASYTAPATGGKIAAAAFRRKAAPRASEGSEPFTPTSPTGSGLPTSPSQTYGNSFAAAGGPRRLPMPPSGSQGGLSGAGGQGGQGGMPPRPETPIEASFALPASPTFSSRRGDDNLRDSGNFADAEPGTDELPPPMYAHEDSLR